MEVRNTSALQLLQTDCVVCSLRYRFYILETSIPYQRSAIWHKLCLLALHFDFSKEDELSYRTVKREVLLELSDVVESLPYFLLYVI